MEPTLLPASTRGSRFCSNSAFTTPCRRVDRLSARRTAQERRLHPARECEVHSAINARPVTTRCAAHRPGRARAPHGRRPARRRR